MRPEFDSDSPRFVAWNQEERTRILKGLDTMTAPHLSVVGDIFRQHFQHGYFLNVVTEEERHYFENKTYKTDSIDHIRSFYKRLLEKINDTK